MRSWLTGFLLAIATIAYAQDEPEYRLELGGSAGLSTYLGDFNGSLTSGMQPWVTAIARYRLNPRMSAALHIGTGKLKGSSDHVETWYPMERYEFAHQLTEAGLRLEYNFWAYGTGREYRGARRLTPFVTIGLGTAFYGGEESGATLTTPLGAGIRYKAAQRLNLTAEWVFHPSLSDHLDGRSDVYGIKSSGLFKNTDCLSTLQVGVTYDLWARCKTCHNDRD